MTAEALGQYPLDNCPPDHYPQTNSPRDSSPLQLPHGQFPHSFADSLEARQVKWVKNSFSKGFISLLMTFRRCSSSFLSDKQNKVKNTLTLTKLQQIWFFIILESSYLQINQKEVFCKILIISPKYRIWFNVFDFFEQNQPIKTLQNLRKILLRSSNSSGILFWCLYC